MHSGPCGGKTQWKNYEEIDGGLLESRLKEKWAEKKQTAALREGTGLCSVAEEILSPSDANKSGGVKAL